MQTPAVQKPICRSVRWHPVAFQQPASKPAIVQPSFTPQTTLEPFGAESPKTPVSSGLFNETPFSLTPQAGRLVPPAQNSFGYKNIGGQRPMVLYFITVSCQPNAQYKGAGFVKKSDLLGPFSKMKSSEIERQKRTFMILDK